MELKDLITELSGAAGPSGSEYGVAELVKKQLLPYMDEVYIDTLGNVIGRKSCGKSGAKRLLIDAHIDEIGFIVTGIEEGFLKISSVGGPDIRMLPASQVKVLTEPPIFGIVACMTVHALSSEDMNKAVKLDDLYIDIGMGCENAVKAVPLGTPVIFDGGCKMLGSESLCGKALDDRACMALVIHTLSLLKDEKLDVDLYVMGSVQEEVGHRGAIAGTFGICPDYAVAVDVTYAKTHDYKKGDALDLGGGPAIGVGPNMTRALSDKFKKLAAEKGMKYQIEVMSGNTGTNAWVMQTSREGVATAVISLPLKYMHTPVETLKLSDAFDISELLATFALSLKGGEL